MLKVSFLLWWKFKTPSKYLVNIVRTLMLMTNITCELFSFLCFLKEKEDETTTCPPARRGQLWTSYPDHTHHTHHAHHPYYTWSTTRGTNRYFHFHIIICRQVFLGGVQMIFSLCKLICRWCQTSRKSTPVLSSERETTESS